MKRIILGLIVLVGLFVLWNNSAEEIVTFDKREKRIQEKEETFFKEDEFIYEPLEEIVLMQKPHVDAGLDVNITKENNVTLTVILDNNGSYDYVWKENENIVGVGRSLTKAYDTGEHLLKVEVLNAGEVVAEDDVKVTAWDYLKIERMYLSEDHELDIYEKDVYDHHNWLLLSEYIDYDKTIYFYNESGKILEQKYENFDDINQSYTLLYTYDEENNLLSMERLDKEENIIESIFYDENGNEIILPSEEKELLEEYGDEYVDKSIKSYNKEGKLIRRELNDDGYKFIETMKYKGDKLVFRERFDGSRYYIYEYGYNENGQRILRRSTTKDKKGNTVWMRSTETEYSKEDKVFKELTRSFSKYEDNTYLSTISIEYTKEGNRLKYERKNMYNEEVVLHLLQGWKYDEEERVIEKNTEALEGVCPSSFDVIKEKRVYIYDKEGNLLKEQHQSQKVNEESLQKEETSMKIVTSYMNTLEN